MKLWAHFEIFHNKGKASDEGTERAGDKGHRTARSSHLMVDVGYCSPLQTIQA